MKNKKGIITKIKNYFKKSQKRAWKGEAARYTLEIGKNYITAYFPYIWQAHLLEQKIEDNNIDKEIVIKQSNYGIKVEI